MTREWTNWAYKVDEDGIPGIKTMEETRDAPQKAPSCGISWARDNTRIWSSVRISGESPPCTQSVSPSIIYSKVCMRVSAMPGWAEMGGQAIAGHVQQQDLNSRIHYNTLSTPRHYHTFAGIRLRCQVSDSISWDLATVIRA
jgi:hypothetical protein